jgi:SAM-dependent methyltransferase
MMNPAEFENIVRTEQTFWWFQGMQRILFTLLSQIWDQEQAGVPPRRVLEAGCGTGYFAGQMANQFDVPVDVSDLAIEGLRYARQYSDVAVQADVRALPFDSSSYPCIVCLDVLVHLQPGQESIPFAEFARVLEPGGLLVLRVSALDILRSRHSAFTQERQRFTRPQLLQLARDHGLEVVRCTYLNSLLLPVALAKFRLWEPLTNAAPASGLQTVAPWLNAALGAALRLEHFWLARGGDFPAGQSLLLLARKPKRN